MAETYDSQMHVALGGAWQRAGLRLIRRAEIRRDAHILDAGCGTGQLTLSLATIAEKGTVVGVDNNPEMLAKARELAESESVPNVIWVEADILTSLPDDRYDVVFCNSTLHLIRPGVQAVVNLVQRMAPGGTLLIQTPAPDFSHEIRDALLKAIKQTSVELPFPAWNSPWYLPAASALATIVREAGCNEARVMEETEPLSFRSPEDATAYFQGMLMKPYLDEVPPERHAEFLSVFGDALPLDNGLPSCLFKRLYLVGKKPQA